MTKDSQERIEQDSREQAIVNEGLSLGIAAKTILQAAFEKASGVNKPGETKLFRGEFDGKPVEIFIGSVFREGENSKGKPEGQHLGKYEWATASVYLGDDIDSSSKTPTYNVTIQHEPKSPFWRASSGESRGCRRGHGPFSMYDIAWLGKRDDSIKYLGESLRAIAEVAEGVQRGTVSPVQK